MNPMPILPKAATAAAIALLCGGTAEGQGTGLSTAEIARRAKPATVVIATIDAAGDTSGFGSGVIVRSDGVVLTNWHVIRGASAAVVQLASGELYDRVDIIDLDSIADIAVLKIPGYQLPVVGVGAGLPTVGERVVAIGAPRGYTETVSEGSLVPFALSPAVGLSR